MIFLLQVCSQTLHLENVCNKNGIIHADSRKEVLEDFLEAKENFVQETQFLGILYLTTTMAIINQGNKFLLMLLDENTHFVLGFYRRVVNNKKRT